MKNALWSLDVEVAIDIEGAAFETGSWLVKFDPMIQNFLQKVVVFRN